MNMITYDEKRWLAFCYGMHLVCCVVGCVSWSFWQTTNFAIAFAALTPSVMVICGIYQLGYDMAMWALDRLVKK